MLPTTSIHLGRRLQIVERRRHRRRRAPLAAGPHDHVHAGRRVLRHGEPRLHRPGRRPARGQPSARSPSTSSACPAWRVPRRPRPATPRRRSRGRRRPPNGAPIDDYAIQTGGGEAPDDRRRRQLHLQRPDQRRSRCSSASAPTTRPAGARGARRRRPSRPTSNRAAGGADGRVRRPGVDRHWSPPANEGSAIQSYNLRDRRRRQRGAQRRRHDLVHVDGLTNGVEYTFRCRRSTPRVAGEFSVVVGVGAPAARTGRARRRRSPSAATGRSRLAGRRAGRQRRPDHRVPGADAELGRDEPDDGHVAAVVEPARTASSSSSACRPATAARLGPVVRGPRRRSSRAACPTCRPRPSAGAGRPVGHRVVDGARRPGLRDHQYETDQRPGPDRGRRAGATTVTLHRARQRHRRTRSGCGPSTSEGVSGCQRRRPTP